MYSEIFHNRQEDRDEYFAADRRFFDPVTQSWIKERSSRSYQEAESPLSFLEEAVFYNRHWNEPHAVGFKLFYEHLVSAELRGQLWQYLESNQQLRIIHLTRRDLVAAFISREMATRTNIWTVLDDEKIEVPSVAPFRVSIPDCIKYCREIRRREQETTSRFRNHKVLTLEYERDLCGDFGGSMAKVQRFLNVEERALSIKTQKQGMKDPSSLVLNFSELQQQTNAALLEQ